LEIWVPYGGVESLLTIQAENLGELVDPAPESHAEEIVPILEERMKGNDELIVCDQKPATAKLLKALSAKMPQDGTVKIFSPSPKRLEEAVPELKGKVLKMSPHSVLVSAGAASEELQVKAAPELADDGHRKLVISTGEPDPLYGYIDARVAACLSCTTGARRVAYVARDGEDMAFFGETKANSAILQVAENFKGATYATVVTRGGEPYSVIEGGAKDARGHYTEQQPSPAKGIVVGAGGRGYDETFSHTLRMAMGALKAVRKGGEVVIVGECRDGIGSKALQMQSMGRITESMLRKGFYEEGMEEIDYLSKLRDNYSVTLLSSLPDLYAAGRFRFRTARNSAQAFERVFNAAGRSAKLHVFTRAPETLLVAARSVS
jgi:hypothetical protein